MGYELLSHPADVRFRATGPTLDEALVSAVSAFAAVAEGGSTSSRAGPVAGTADATVSHHLIHVESEDGEALLFDFLAELVLLQELEVVAVVEAEDCAVTPTTDGYTLDAAVRCRPIDEPLFDIKSPTYSEMRVEAVDDGWVLEATLDV